MNEQELIEIIRVRRAMGLNADVLQQQLDAFYGVTPRRETDGLPYPTNIDTLCMCSNCESVQRWGSMHEWLCNECADNNNRCECCDETECVCDGDDDSDNLNIPERMFAENFSSDFMSSESGKHITSSRIFSAEIECYQQSNAKMRETAKQLHQNIGISSDGSLGSKGVEFQTPKLKGKQGEAVIKVLCKILNDNNFSVDSSTGLHIHLDGKGLLPRTLTTIEPVALKQLWQFYVVFDDVMLSFLPVGRRDNRYCRPMKRTATYESISRCYTQRDIEKLWYKTDNTGYINDNKAHKYHDSRYHGVNLHILLADKHLEVRFHSGTLNSTKILEWTALHQQIADLAAAGNLLTSESMLELPLDKKTKMFFSILNLPNRAQKYFERRQEQFKTVTGAGRTDESQVSAVSETN